MLNKPLEFFTVVESGDMVETSLEMYWYLRQQVSDVEIEQNSFTFNNYDDEALLIWKESCLGGKTKYYARMLYTEIFSRGCLGSINVTSIGTPSIRPSQAFPYAILSVDGDLKDLEFLDAYRFANIKPIREFLRYYQSGIKTVHRLGWRGEFLLHTSPDLYCDAEFCVSHQSLPSFQYTEPLPY